MNRRKAIARIALIGSGTAAAYSGLKWYELKKAPDLAYLLQRRELLADLAETIIPATDSPGAKEAAVQDFIIMMIRDCTEIKTQNKFIDGLKELEHYCEAEYHHPFNLASDQEKHTILKYFEEKGKSYKGIFGKVQNRLTGKSFFNTLKEYTAEGYCTSEAGATKGLAYIPIPGKYLGCVPMQQGQKSWATK
jgi:Gluconate 2-dehydrogenase subunit 3